MSEMREAPWDLATYQQAYENLMGTAKKLREENDRQKAENAKLKAELEFFRPYEDLICDIRIANGEVE